MKNGKPVVLVVEDSPMIRMGAVDLVLSAGYETLEAGDAEEAYRVLESRADIDLVFTNVQMPATRDGIKPQHPGSLAPCKADRRLRRSHDRREHAARWESVLFEALQRTLHHRGDGTPAFERASALPYCVKWSGQTRSREIGSTASWLINGNLGQISDLGAVYRTSAFALRSRAAEGLSS